MQRTILYVLTAVVVGFLLLYSVTYTIRFNEAGVVTTFGAADSAATSRPGLGLKWPYPIQSVTTYDVRPRQTQVNLETQQTRDSRQIIVKGFALWRVKDPLVFFKRWSTAGPRAVDHYRAADDAVRSNLRSAMGAISRFNMSDFFNADPSVDGLGQLEAEVLRVLTAGEAEGQAVALADLGIEVVDVGVSEVVLPQDTTTKVMERMGQARDRIAKRIADQAAAEATAIRAKADEDAKKIEAFARELASEIRKQGDAEAVEFIKQMSDPSGGGSRLAVLLREIELLKGTLGRRGTQVVVPWTWPGFRLMMPDARRDVLRDLGVPASGGPSGTSEAERASATGGER